MFLKLLLQIQHLFYRLVLQYIFDLSMVLYIVEQLKKPRNEDILTDLLGVYDRAKDIDFDKIDKKITKNENLITGASY